MEELMLKKVFDFENAPSQYLAKAKASKKVIQDLVIERTLQNDPMVNLSLKNFEPSVSLFIGMIKLGDS
jgi:hypothetical protein